MGNEIEVSCLETEKYISAKNVLSANLKLSIVDISVKLYELDKFYNKPQTKHTRKGVLELLSRIITKKDFDVLCEILSEICKVSIDMLIDIGGEGPYTFFYLIGKKMTKL